MLLRMILKQVFGCETYTKYYNPPPPTEANLAIREASGTAPLPGPWAEAYPRMKSSGELCLVKTHDAPEDAGKAIYTTREGLAAIFSYRHFLKDFASEEHTLEEIILGKVLFGSWGQHIDQWNPLERPNTLLLKYEDLMERADQQIGRIAQFLQLKPKGKWVNEFDKFHRLNSKLFRKGKIEDVSQEFSKADKDLFWALHGDWMVRLGYADQGANGNPLPAIRSALAQRKAACASP